MMNKNIWVSKVTKEINYKININPSLAFPILNPVDNANINPGKNLRKDFTPKIKDYFRYLWSDLNTIFYTFNL